jgi:alkylation response protein AidB-like acyl-CoA dehydrogenase
MFTLTADQKLFDTTTAQFLQSAYPPPRLREMASLATTFDETLWRKGTELGWVALLVPEDCGGGSISGNGLSDLIIVAYQFGRHAAPGPLFGTNLVAAALSRWGWDTHRDGELAQLLSGTATAAWAGTIAAGVTAAASGDHIVINGELPCVEGAADATYLLLSAQDGRDCSYYLLDVGSEGVETTPLDGVDLSRRFYAVSLRDVRLPAGARVGEPDCAHTYDVTLVDYLATLCSAEIVGAMERCVTMTLGWLQDRYSFGRPLGSYQEIKHRMADMRTALEAGAAVTARAATAVGGGAADASQWASAACAYVSRVGPEVIQDCIQMHGGIGVTAEHDLHLFLRRAVVDAQGYGTAQDFTRRLVDLIDTKG